jgi:hypothetical protein
MAKNTTRARVAQDAQDTTPTPATDWRSLAEQDRKEREHAAAGEIAKIAKRYGVTLTPQITLGPNGVIGARIAIEAQDVPAAGGVSG